MEPINPNSLDGATTYKLKLMTTSLVTIALILVFAVLKILSSLMIQVTLALLLAGLVYPAVQFLISKKIPKVLSILFVIIVSFGLIALFLGVLVKSVQKFAVHVNASLPSFADVLDTLLKQLNLSEYLELFSTREIFTQLGRWVSGYVFRLANSGVTFFTAFLFIAIMTTFFLLETQNFSYKIHTHLSAYTAQRLAHISHEVTKSMNRYLWIKTIISAATGFTIYFCLFLAGVSYATVWGLLGFIFNFIPVLGSAIIIVATMIMSLVQLYDHPMALWFALVTMPGIHFVYGQILEPRLQGNGLNISPFLIVIGVVFWGWMWGVAGAFLSVPMMVIVKVIIANFGPYKYVSGLMEVGTPPKAV